MGSVARHSHEAADAGLADISLKPNNELENLQYEEELNYTAEYEVYSLTPNYLTKITVKLKIAYNTRRVNSHIAPNIFSY